MEGGGSQQALGVRPLTALLTCSQTCRGRGPGVQESLGGRHPQGPGSQELWSWGSCGPLSSDALVSGRHPPPHL